MRDSNAVRRHSTSISRNLEYYMKNSILIGAGILALAFSPKLRAIDVVSTFATNPFAPGGWTFGAGNNSNNQFTWDQANSALDVHMNSSLPTARIDLPIGTTLTMSTDFTMTTIFSMNIISAPSDQQMELAFGLVNHSMTGGDRTGSNANPSSDNVFDTVEFNYFPNISPLYGGPTLTPTVFGAQYSNYDAFSNFNSVFGPTSDLNGNSLPQSQSLEATLAYTAATESLVLTLSQINANNSLTTLDTVPLDVSVVDPTFSVDSLAIMAYGDGYTTSGDPSLVANMAIQQIGVVTPSPEPASAGLFLLGAGGMLMLRKRRRA